MPLILKYFFLFVLSKLDFSWSSFNLFLSRICRQPLKHCLENISRGAWIAALNIVDETRWHGRDLYSFMTEWWATMCQYLHSILLSIENIQGRKLMFKHEYVGDKVWSLSCFLPNWRLFFQVCPYFRVIKRAWRLVLGRYLLQYS